MTGVWVRLTSKIKIWYLIPVILLCQSGWANIWIDETFDDGTAFDASALDVYDQNLPTTPLLSFTRNEGTVSTNLAYNGTYSYRLKAGEGLSVAEGSYENPTNGAFQYFQFALALDTIPQAGDVAEFRWNWTVGSIEYSFFLKLVSTGSTVNLVAGEDLAYATSETISTIDQVNTWHYITLQLQKNAESAADSRTGQTLSQGLRFYVDRTTPSLEVLLPGLPGDSDHGRDWSWEVFSGAIYLDDFYWEGGMTNGGEDSSNLRPFVEPCNCPSFPEDYPVQVNSVQVDPVYADMLLPQETGWLGSDVAHSIPLSATQNLWLFADTFIGSVVDGKRAGGAKFINSSIGIQDTTALPPGNVKFFWGPGDTSFFPHQAGTQGEYYWPTAGIMLEGRLYIFCYNVTSGFSLPGTTLIKIPNPLDSPDQWIQQARDMEIGDDHRGFHTAVYAELPYIYLLGYDDPGDSALNRRAVLARILAENLIASATSSAYEFWVDIGGTPQWSASQDNLITLFEPGVTESTLHYDSELGRYLSTTYSAFGSEIYLTTAPELTGPWSEPVCLYDIPEHDAVSFDIISYAARFHPELSTTAGEVVLTYATNAYGTISPLFTVEGLGIYHPRFVRINFQVAPNVCIWMVY